MTKTEKNEWHYSGEMLMVDKVIETSACDILITESSGSGSAVLFIHGNSSCKEVFKNQMQGKVGQAWHCIAMDLPGHGQSADAANPEATYNMPGYADVALELMTKLGHEQFAMFGWSLGGHIGIEMLDRSNRLTGLMISGTPPVGKEPDALSLGFKPSEHMHLAGPARFHRRGNRRLCARHLRRQRARSRPFFARCGGAKPMAVPVN